MCALFREVFEDSGFTAADPSYHVISVEGVRFVVLLDGEKLTVTTSQPRVCTVSEVKESDLPAGVRLNNTGAAVSVRFFRLRALSKGVTTIRASGVPVSQDAHMLVIVKRKLQVRIYAHRVQDSAGHATRRPAAEVSKWIGEVNRIWLNRANVQVILHGIRDLPFPGDLGRIVTVPNRPGGLSEHPLAKMAIEGVGLNLFLVWSLQWEGSTRDELALTTLGTANTPPGMGLTFFQDDAGPNPAVVLAHEIGHHLGLNHKGHKVGELMAETDSAMSSDPLLTPLDLLIANP